MGRIVMEISKKKINIDVSASSCDFVTCTGMMIKEMVRKLTEDYGMEKEIKNVLFDYINSDCMKPENLSIEIGSRVVIPSTSGKVHDMADKMVEGMHRNGSNLFQSFLDFLGEKYGK